MSALSGKRVLYDGTPAPVLRVRYECVDCRGQEILDAYNGPPRHRHVIINDDATETVVWRRMKPLAIVHDSAVYVGPEPPTARRQT